MWQPRATASESQGVPRDELGFWQTSFFTEEASSLSPRCRGHQGIQLFSVTLGHVAFQSSNTRSSRKLMDLCYWLFPIAPASCMHIRFSHWFYHLKQYILPTSFYSNLIFSENKKKRSCYCDWFTTQCRNSLKALLQSYRNTDYKNARLKLLTILHHSADPCHKCKVPSAASVFLLKLVRALPGFH